MAVHSTDFSEYATGTQPTFWSEPWNTGAVWATAPDVNAMGGAFLRKSTGEHHDLLSWNDIASSVVQEFVARVRLPSSAASRQAAIYLRTQGAGQAGATGVEYAMAPGQISIGSLSNGNYTAHQTQTGTFAADTWYWLRGRVEGGQNGTAHTCYLKVWTGKFTDEPAAWNLNVSPALPTSSGGAGLFSYSTNFGEFDYFSIGTEGDKPTAPVSDGLMRTSTGLLFRDDFNRADGDPGTNYANYGVSSYAIVGNKLVVKGNSQEGRLIVNLTERTEMLTQARMTNPTGDTGVDVGLQSLAIKSTAGNASSGWLVQAHGGEAQLWQLAGGYVKLDFEAFTVGTVQHVYSIYAKTGSQQAWIDGGFLLTGTDTTPGSGFPAIRTTAASTTEIHVDDLIVCTTRTITASGLPAGYQLRAGGRTAAESGGTATLDIGGLILPIGKVELLDGVGVVVGTFYGDVWGGDNFAASVGTVALVTQDPAHAAATNTRDTLVAGGYEVTLLSDNDQPVPSSQFDLADLSVYDAVVIVRATSSRATTNATKLKQSNKPLVVAVVEAGMTNGTYTDANNASVPVEMGYADSMYINNADSDEVDFLAVAHPILEGIPAGRAAIYGTLHFLATLKGTAVGYTALANGDPDTVGVQGSPALVAMDKGTANFANYTHAERVAISGILYGAPGYTDVAKKSIVQALQWVIAGVSTAAPEPAPAPTYTDYLVVGGVKIPTAIRSDNEEAQKGGFTTARSYQGQMYPEGRWVKRKWTGRTIPLGPTLAATIRAQFLSLKPVLCSGTMLRADVTCYIEHSEANAPFIDPTTGVYYPDGKVFSFTLTEK